jgi:peptidoglycan/LPS O-acetylase OafA/YrhL
MVVLVHCVYYAPAPQQATDRVGRFLLALISRLGVGVPLFFVISGYCIAATADSARRKPGALGTFFMRRFRRIFPPYWAALVLAAAVMAVAAVADSRLLADHKNPLPHPASLTGMQWLGNTTLTEQWRYHLAGGPKRLLLGPAWSLCYEEQFYALCGLLLLLAPRRFFAGVAAMSLLVLGLLPLAFGRTGPSVSGFFFDGLWLLFAAGVLVYHQQNYGSKSQRRALLLLLCAGLAAAAYVRYVSPLGRSGVAQRDHSFGLVAGLAFALLLVALRPWDQRLARARLLRPLAWCGGMCYSLYLVHWPVTKLVTLSLALHGVNGVWPTLLVSLPLATAASVAVAWAFHRLVERRFLNAPAHATRGDRAVTVSHSFA